MKAGQRGYAERPVHQGRPQREHVAIGCVSTSPIHVSSVEACKSPSALRNQDLAAYTRRVRCHA